VVLLLESGVDDPIVALSGIVLGSLLLRERLAQAEVVSDAVLPARLLGVAVELEGI
jgi:hypothetical protein